MRSNFRERTACVVRPGLPCRSRGLAGRGGRTLQCALGKGGVRARKREGDGATPLGHWRLARVLYRADRVARPRTLLPVRAIRANDGWCDDTRDRNYNRPVALPYPASAEKMMRADHLYDIVVVLDHNQRPRVRGLGSAVFVHLAREGYAPTEGCVAFAERDLRMLLARARPGDAIEILA